MPLTSTLAATLDFNCKHFGALDGAEIAPNSTSNFLYLSISLEITKLKVTLEMHDIIFEVLFL